MLALLASRALGVVRQVIFNAMFNPSSAAVNAYIASSRLPDTLYNLVAGGALIHAFVPVFLSYEKEHGEYESWQLASLVFNVLLVVLTLIIIVSELLAPVFVTNVLVPGFTKTEPAAIPITITMTRIMLMQPLILGLGTIASAILNSKRQFLLPALALAVYNIGMLAGLLVAKIVPGVGIYGPVYGTLVAVGLQVLVQIPGLVKQGMRYTFTWNLRHPGLHQILILLLPNALALGIASFGNIVDTQFSSQIKDTVSLAALQNAEMLQALPIALIGQAIGQALLPHLAMQAASGQYIRMRQAAFKVMGMSILLTIPALLALIALGVPLIDILFRHGTFTQHAANVTYLALIGYAIAIPGMAMQSLFAAGFYAFKDAVTPFLSNTLGLLAHWGLLALFFYYMQGPNIIFAVPFAIAISSTVESALLALILLFRLQRRIKADKAMLRLQRRRLYIQMAQSRNSYAPVLPAR
jgi:putative peptidoglycan lipid II flippase